MILLRDMQDDTAQWLLSSIAQGLKRGSVSFPEFVDRYFSHYQENAPSSMHEWLAEYLNELPRRRNVKSAVVAPRGSAKSSYSSCFFPVYCICEKLEDYLVISSDTFSQGIQHLSNIKEELTNNDELAADYPDAVGEGPTWARDSIITANGIRIDVIGTQGKIRGRRKRAARPSLIILDDPENDESAVSPAMRAKTRDWFDRGVLKAGRPGTNVVVLGTVINAECLVAQLQERPGWETHFFKSIIKWPTRMDLWEQWEKHYFQDTEAAAAFYKEHQVEMNEGAEVLWPDREPLLDLMKMRVEDGPIAFASEKQNEPVNPTQCRFEEAWFENIWFDEWPADAYFFAACDPVLGKDSKKGDYCAWVWGCWRPGDPNVYVDAHLERLSLEGCIDQGIHIGRQFRLQGMGFESNGFQAVIAKDLSRKLGEAGLLGIPVVEITNNDPKPTRIEGLAPYLYRRHIKFKRNSKGAKMLVAQTKMFPIATYDDGPDALEMLMKTIKSWVEKKQAEEGQPRGRA